MLPYKDNLVFSSGGWDNRYWTPSGIVAATDSNTTFVEGQHSGALTTRFNGTNAKRVTSLQLGAVPKLTVSCWVNVTAVGGTEDFINEYDFVGGVISFAILKDTTNKIRFYTGSDAATSYARPSTLYTSGWHHIVGCHDGTNTWIIVDNEDIAKAATPLAPAAAGVPIRFGTVSNESRWGQFDLGPTHIWTGVGITSLNEIAEIRREDIRQSMPR